MCRWAEIFGALELLYVLPNDRLAPLGSFLRLIFVPATACAGDSLLIFVLTIEYAIDSYCLMCLHDMAVLVVGNFAPETPRFSIYYGAERGDRILVSFSRYHPQKSEFVSALAVGAHETLVCFWL